MKDIIERMMAIEKKAKEILETAEKDAIELLEKARREIRVNSEETRAKILKESQNTYEQTAHAKLTAIEEDQNRLIADHKYKELMERYQVLVNEFPGTAAADRAAADPRRFHRDVSPDPDRGSPEAAPERRPPSAPCRGSSVGCWPVPPGV